jgi:hypothetical protein
VQAADSGFTNWLHEHWNVLDAIVYSLFWIGFSLRCWGTVGNGGWVGIQAAKLVHALGFIALFSRTCRFYFNLSAVGPKIMMILNMGSDLATFLALFVIIWLSYGTAQAALLNPTGLDLFGVTAEWTWGQITFHPYFQIFGELMLDQLEEQTQCLGPNPFGNCGDSLQEFVPVFAGIYFFLTNIVLINLLIAMMAKTFSADDEESHQLYYMQKYDLLMESVTPRPCVCLSACSPTTCIGDLTHNRVGILSVALVWRLPTLTAKSNRLDFATINCYQLLVATSRCGADSLFQNMST